MLADRLSAHIFIRTAGYDGPYTSTKDPAAGSWSWYPNGDQRALGPHFTVSTAAWEVAANGQWVGFHISKAFNGMNAKVQFAIAGGVVRCVNQSFANLPKAEEAVARAEFRTDHAVYLALARAFHAEATSKDAAKLVREADAQAIGNLGLQALFR